MLRQLLNTFFTPSGDPTPSLVKQDEENLQFSELRYLRLFETAQDGILILDADSGKIVDVNPFLKKLLGYPEKELLRKSINEVHHFR